MKKKDQERDTDDKHQTELKYHKVVFGSCPSILLQLYVLVLIASDDTGSSIAISILITFLKTSFLMISMLKSIFEETNNSWMKIFHNYRSISFLECKNGKMNFSCDSFCKCVCIKKLRGQALANMTK